MKIWISVFFASIVLTSVADSSKLFGLELPPEAETYFNIWREKIPESSPEVVGYIKKAISDLVSMVYAILKDGDAADFIIEFFPELGDGGDKVQAWTNQLEKHPKVIENLEKNDIKIIDLIFRANEFTFEEFLKEFGELADREDVAKLEQMLEEAFPGFQDLFTKKIENMVNSGDIDLSKMNELDVEGNPDLSDIVQLLRR